MRQDAPTDQEHRRGAGDRQALHQPRRQSQDRTSQPALRPWPCAVAGLARQRQPAVIELDDGRHEAVDADRHDQRDARQHRQLGRERRLCNRPERDRDDLGRKNEIGAHGALDLVTLQCRQIGVRVDESLRQFGPMGEIFAAVGQEPVGQLLEALVAEKQATNHQQWRHCPGRQRADRQCRGHEDHLVDQRSLRDRPDHRQFPVGAHAGDLLSIERQIVAQHAGGLLGGDLGQHRHVVEHGGDVVDQGQEVADGHRRCACGAR